MKENILITVAAGFIGFSLSKHLLEKNIQVFGDEVELDIEIKNPTLQYKKRVEVDCIKIIHEVVFQKAKVKVKVKGKQIR